MQSDTPQPGVDAASAALPKPAPSATRASDLEATGKEQTHKSEYWTQCLGCFSWTCIPLITDEVPCSNEACGLQVVRQL